MLRCLSRSHDGNFTPDALAQETGPVWLDVDTTGEDRDRLAGLLGDWFAFHPQALQDALIESHPCHRVDDWRGYLFIVLHIPDPVGAAPQEITLFMGVDVLVTLHRGPMPALERIWQEADRERVETPCRLLCCLADSVAAHSMPLINAFDAEIAQFEAAAAPPPRGLQLANRIDEIKESLTRLREMLGKVKLVMYSLSCTDYAVVGDEERTCFRETYDGLASLCRFVEGRASTAMKVLDMARKHHIAAVTELLEKDKRFTKVRMFPFPEIGRYIVVGEVAEQSAMDDLKKAVESIDPPIRVRWMVSIIPPAGQPQ